MITRSKIFPILIISSLLAVGLFGIFGINMADDNGRHFCPISPLSSDGCALFGSPFSEALHHISALRNFAQGVININAFSLTLLFLLIFAFAIFATFLQKTPFLQTSFRLSYQKPEELDYSQKKRFLRWLAIRHKKDPHASQRAHDYS